MTKRQWRKKILALTAATMLIASHTGAVFATGLAPVEGETVAESEITKATERETTEAPEETTAAEDETVSTDETTVMEDEMASSEETTTAEDETIGEELSTAEPETTISVPEMEEPTGEAVFINRNDEEVVPSELVGINYEDIADDYDGEANVRKEYVESEEYDADVIMESYIDEDGNLILIISRGMEKPQTIGLETDTDSDRERTPSIDGSLSGWDDIPVSYEYNWDNSQNCWQWGVWVDGVCYKTEPGTYGTDVRHAMQLYADEEYVYLHITFARDFSRGNDQIANGNDYQFWVDGEMAAYQVETPDGKSLSYNSMDPGIYEVDVRHRDSSYSYVLTDGAEAYYTVNDGNLNNELELKIPLEQFTVQNGSIDLDNYSKIEFFTPNLMYRKIGCAGSPTGSVPFAAAAFTLVPTSFIWLKKKKK